MKDKVVLLLVSIFVVCLTSCLGDDDDYSYTPSGDAQVYRFHLESDSVPGLENVLFAIDNLNHRIYNPDSMAYGTVIKEKVICTMNTRGIMGVQVKQTAIADTLAWWNTTDSLDFSKPVEFVITPMDGIHKLTYTAWINIHTVKPDSMDWQMFASDVFPHNYTEQTVLVSNDSTRYLMFAKAGGSYKLQTAPLSDAGAWTEEALTGFPADALVQQMVYHTDTLVVPAADGSLYYSENDGRDWMKAEEAPYLVAILGDIKKVKNEPNKLAAVVKEEGDYYYYNTADLRTWTKGEKVEAGFPVSGFGRANYYNMYKEYLLVVAGRDVNNALTNTTWGTSTGLSWAKYTNKAPFEEGREGVMMANYDDKIYLIGGMNEKGEASKDIVLSLDYGINWEAVDSLKELPASYDARAFSSLAVDKDKYLVIFGGKQAPASAPLNQVWKGRINYLGFDVPYAGKK